MPEHTPGTSDELRLHLLVLRCQSGDERAFAQIFDRFSGRTLAYLGGLVGGDAEDVQQEVWLAVYRGVGGLSNPRAFRTWLFQTTRHRAIDFLRRLHRERELAEIAAVENELLGAIADEDGGGDERELMPEILALLSPRHREVLLLRYQDALSYGEIALVVGCSMGTVRSRLHHAKRRARELVEQRR